MVGGSDRIFVHEHHYLLGLDGKGGMSNIGRQRKGTNFD